MGAIGGQSSDLCEVRPVDSAPGPEISDLFLVLRTFFSLFGDSVLEPRKKEIGEIFA